MTARNEQDLQAVKDYLDASMAQDPERAARYVATPFLVRFTGNRHFDTPSGPTSFNAARYKWVKKRIERYDVVPGETETIIYSLGYLYGEWPDGTAFDHNRYVDRFVVRDGLIVETDVWNDSAEWILDPSVARS
ncbi:MAG TPA: nuclear transport factor 2 family protein [Paracoccus sp. (in: a-proteobacteria)]|uniref:nuclear transport factor 2 family protein n=1 Tax=Paracoccus sp. TaxID=267 RepID=UPI002C21085E|nr:nuclear transport factor 2 family protein [Paracoccus sp. (in: a-proteobacteria)]HWL56788.1 nuclear transport factor 2 family protein [Paracoccus sp. (in: a-proteobacteria)]